MKLSDPNLQQWIHPDQEIEAVVIIRKNSNSQFSALAIYNYKEAPMGVRFIAMQHTIPESSWKEFLANEPWMVELTKIPEGLTPAQQAYWIKAQAKTE